LREREGGVLKMDFLRAPTIGQLVEHNLDNLHKLLAGNIRGQLH
jgi:hypothetical protein